MQEFLDFLGGQPPFDALSADDLRRLVQHLKVRYFTAGTVIVDENAAPLRHMWVIRSGQVEVRDRGRVVDVLTAGDVFGHVSLLSGLRPALTVQALEDVVGYQLPDPRQVLQNPDALQFSHFGTLIVRERLIRPGVLAFGQVPVERFMRPAVWAEPTDPVRDAAARIGRHDASCVLVDTDRGLGIATDRDFRAQVATGRVAVDAPLAEIVSVPARSVSRRTTAAAGLLAMVEAGVHHLVVLDDSGRPLGVVRAIDVGSVEGRDPLLIRAAIDAAEDVEALARAASLLTPTLAELSDNGVPALRVAALMTAVIESVLRRLLQLSPTPEGAPAATSWLVLGSLARREPLPASDVDTAVVWADEGLGDGGADLVRGHASEVLARMEACHLRRCPDGANADNPLFSRSSAAWVRAATRWIADPNAQGALLLSSIVADSRPVTDVALGRAITDTVRATTQSLAYREAMLRFATASRPPVGFVREFVVDHRGEHRGGFDLKRGGLVPITALARWSALVLGDVGGGTLERVGRARDHGLFTAGEADVLVRAFEDIYGLAFERELEALRRGGTASTWVTPRDLDDLARRHLRESFRAVATVQVTVANEWINRMGRRAPGGG